MAYVAAAASLLNAQQQVAAEKYNAAVMAGEGSAAWGQTTNAEGNLRNSNREALGKQTAAYAAAGVGYGGSTEGALRQSITNEEMDALNVRYRGALTAWGYKTQSGLDMQKADQTATAGFTTAAAQLVGNAAKYPSSWSSMFNRSPGSYGGTGAGGGTTTLGSPEQMVA